MNEERPFDGSERASGNEPEGRPESGSPSSGSSGRPRARRPRPDADPRDPRRERGDFRADAGNGHDAHESDPSDDQSRAINRSRPIYEQPDRGSSRGRATRGSYGRGPSGGGRDRRSGVGTRRGPGGPGGPSGGFTRGGDSRPNGRDGGPRSGGGRDPRNDRDRSPRDSRGNGAGRDPRAPMPGAREGGARGRDGRRADDRRSYGPGNRDTRGPRPAGPQGSQGGRGYREGGDARRPSQGDRNRGRVSRSERRTGDPHSPQRRVDPRGRAVHPNRVETDEKFVLPDNPREAALRILHEVDTRGVFADRLLDGAHARTDADPRDQALLHELVKGTLRWRGRIDAVLDPIVHIGIHQVQPWVRNILRLGAYQILFLDRIPAHSAVDEAVKLANQYGHPGTAGLANSVLRKLADGKDAIVLPEGDDAESLSAWGSHPRWMVERWLARFGPEGTRALLTANNRHVPVGLRVNLLRGTREQLIAKLASEGVEARAAELSPDLVWVDSHHAPGRLAAFKQGFCTAQDESEALVGRLVAPQPHERLLDLCAAPGGKSTHLAELMADEGEVWAMERAPERVQALETTIARLGAHAIHVVQGDGRSYSFPMPFDRVLVDAPCSGLGVLARRSDARWRKTPDTLRDMPPIQLDLLMAAGSRLRPGGVLVYSVCSFEPEETTHVVERFLRASSSFVLETASGLLPESVVDENGFMVVLPHVHGCDGAFAARFRKT